MKICTICKQEFEPTSEVWRKVSSYYRGPCRECRRKQAIKYRLARKTKVLSFYGGGTSKCCCCGIDNIVFLCLDHVNNDGNEERKTVHPKELYGKLIKENFPPGYQTLCYNCNAGKQLCGVCPHQQEKDNEISA